MSRSKLNDCVEVLPLNNLMIGLELMTLSVQFQVFTSSNGPMNFLNQTNRSINSVRISRHWSISLLDACKMSSMFLYLFRLRLVLIVPQ